MCAIAANFIALDLDRHFAKIGTTATSGLQSEFQRRT
jgi:hypothetical protein